MHFCTGGRRRCRTPRLMLLGIRTSPRRRHCSAISAIACFPRSIARGSRPEGSTDDAAAHPHRSMSVSRSLAYAFVGLIVIAMYAWRLQDSPIYLAHDEVVFAVNAQSIAATGRDVTGRWLPLYFHIGGDFWATPVNIYFSALLFRFLPISEATIRLPSMIVGLLVVVLTYVVGERIFKSERTAAIAAVLLALTPAL